MAHKPCQNSHPRFFFLWLFPHLYSLLKNQTCLSYSDWINVTSRWKNGLPDEMIKCDFQMKMNEWGRQLRRTLSLTTLPSSYCPPCLSFWSTFLNSHLHWEVLFIFSYSTLASISQVKLPSLMRLITSVLINLVEDF